MLLCMDIRVREEREAGTEVSSPLSTTLAVPRQWHSTGVHMCLGRDFRTSSGTHLSVLSSTVSRK